MKHTLHDRSSEGIPIGEVEEGERGAAGEHARHTSDARGIPAREVNEPERGVERREVREGRVGQVHEESAGVLWRSDAHTRLSP